MTDAVVIGAGHNGLVAANLLADAGWDVVVLEAADRAGGAVRSDELTVPGAVHDVFSAFYPFAVASPPLVGLELERHGLRWCRAPLVVAHPTPDGRCAVLSTDPATTMRSLDTYAPGDGERWAALYETWERVAPALLPALMTPFPPVIDGLRLAGRVGLRELPRFLRFLTLPMRRLAEEEFAGTGGGLLLAGHAAHADLSPEATGSGVFGWMLAGLGQQHGFPVPEGGAGALIEALVRRLVSLGGRVETSAPVAQVVVRGGRAVGVRTVDGREIDARHAVLAAVDAPQLFLRLVDEEHLSPAFLHDAARFQLDAATFKVDWLLDGPAPWPAEPCRRAGTVHLAESMDALTVASAELAQGLLPSCPPLVMGQMSVADPTRAPGGRHTSWAYTSVPQRIRGDAGGDIGAGWSAADAERFAERIEQRVERFAPGFRDRIAARHVLTPPQMEAINRSLLGGGRNSGTAQIHQQLVFRPTPGLGRPETPVPRLYLASASAHPGGGVHGGPGAIAARAALRAERLRRATRAVGASAAMVAGQRARRRSGTR